jgi:A/G-specific adenine glycosylase
MTRAGPARAFAKRLLAWYDAHRRDLPWRGDPSPWGVWVSEIMLQQTRVEAVRGIYLVFMARYPAPADFARVDDDELLAAWRGLGYYRRARLLREGARMVEARHGGVVPGDPGALAALPGIGEYTCGAVASIAFGWAMPAVDGNVERVLARHLVIAEIVKTGAGKRAVRAAAASLLDRERPGDFNQALMELGATVCKPRSPRCADCPVASSCGALAEGLVAALPVLPKRRVAVDVEARAALVRRQGGEVIGFRVPKGEINAGQVDLPGPGPTTYCAGVEQLGAVLWERFGVRFGVGAELANIRHSITHHRIRMIAHAATIEGRVRAPMLSARPDDPAIPWTTTARKLFARVGLAAAEA